MNSFDWHTLDLVVKTDVATNLVAQGSFVTQLVGAPDLGASAVDYLDRWVESAGASGPLHYVGRSSLSPRPLTSAELKRIRSALGRRTSNNEFFWINSAADFDVGDHSIEFNLWPKSAGSSSVITISAPPTVGDAQDVRSMIDSFESLLDTKGLAYASAGYGMNLVWGNLLEQAVGPRLLATCMRYRGLDLPNRDMSPYLLDVIKSPGWLTYLSTPMASRLAPVTGHPPPKYAEVQQAGGLLLIAGAKPPIGDVNRGAPDLDALRFAARRVRPLRVTEWTDIPMPIESIDVDSSIWLARLDAGIS